MELGERDASGWVLRVQVEGKPEDLSVELAPQLLGNRLAEPAEGSDVVAPDDDRMVGHSSMVPKCGCVDTRTLPVRRLARRQEVGIERPGERRAEVVMLALQNLEGLHLLRAVEGRLRLHCDLEKVLRVRTRDGVRVVGCRETVRRKLEYRPRPVAVETAGYSISYSHDNWTR